MGDSIRFMTCGEAVGKRTPSTSDGVLNLTGWAELREAKPMLTRSAERKIILLGDGGCQLVANEDEQTLDATVAPWA